MGGRTLDLFLLLSPFIGARAQSIGSIPSSSKRGLHLVMHSPAAPAVPAAVPAAPYRDSLIEVLSFTRIRLWILRRGLGVSSRLGLGIVI